MLRESIHGWFGTVGGWFGTADWGSVPEWFGAVGTILAVIVALRFGLKDGKRLDAELRSAAEDRAASHRELGLIQHDRRADLARKVLFTLEPLDPNEAGRGLPRNGARFQIFNFSEFPIYDVKAGYSHENYEVNAVRKWDSIAPGGSRAVETTSSVREFGGLPTVAFLDVRGRGWFLDNFGILRVGNNRVDFVKLHDGVKDAWPDDGMPKCPPS